MSRAPRSATVAPRRHARSPAAAAAWPYAGCRPAAFSGRRHAADDHDVPCTPTSSTGRRRAGRRSARLSPAGLRRGTAPSSRHAADGTAAAPSCCASARSRYAVDMADVAEVAAVPARHPDPRLPRVAAWVSPTGGAGCCRCSTCARCSVSTSSPLAASARLVVRRRGTTLVGQACVAEAVPGVYDVAARRPLRRRRRPSLRRPRGWSRPGVRRPRAGRRARRRGRARAARAGGPAPPRRLTAPVTRSAYSRSARDTDATSGRTSPRASGRRRRLHGWRSGGVLEEAQRRVDGHPRGDRRGARRVGVRARPGQRRRLLGAPQAALWIAVGFVSAGGLARADAVRRAPARRPRADRALPGRARGRQHRLGRRAGLGHRRRWSGPTGSSSPRRCSSLPSRCPARTACSSVLFGRRPS